jgi:WD40 repeat protein
MSQSSAGNVQEEEEEIVMNMSMSINRSIKSSGTNEDNESDHESTGVGGEEGDAVEGEKEEVKEEHVRAAVPLKEREAEVVAVELTEKEFEETVTVTLSETSTKFLLSITGVKIQSDTKEHARITDKNKRYDDLVATISTSDLYVSHHAQTFNFPTKNKQVDASPPPMRDAAAYVSAWDIYDTFQNKIKGENMGNRRSSLSVGGDKKESAAVKSDLSRYIDEEVSITLASAGCLLPMSETDAASTEVKDGAQAIAQNEIKRILSDPGLLKNIKCAERLIQQNIYHKAHLLYRDVPDAASLKVETAPSSTLEKTQEATEGAGGDVALSPPLSPSSAANGAADLGTDGLDKGSSGADGPKDVPASLQLLWQFECPLTHGRNVSSFAWNHHNPDLLVVGYGDFRFAGKHADGLLLFWSLKNPNYPERVIRVPHGVTAVDFSSTQPALLAVGLYDGTVSIYNVKLDQDTPVLESAHEAGKHSDAVWQVKWVNKGLDRGENIVSISTDGRVSEWSMKKGLQYSDLMLLKRVQNSTGCSWRPPQSKGEGIIVRHAAGMAFDFAPDSAGVYYVGTEDGVLHKCSSSYNDNYLENYFGHSGPIYKVRVSPFWNNAILTCSADWTVKLWDTKEASPKISFQSTNLSDAVYDIAWSPKDSTVFASVTGDGRVELWDLKHNAQVPCTWYQSPPREGDHHSSLDKVGDGNADNSNSNNSSNDDDQKHKKKKKSDADEDSPLDGAPSPTIPAGSTNSSHTNVKMSAVLFAPTAPILVAGDDSGRVKVFRIFGLDYPESTHEEQIQGLYQVMNTDEESAAVEGGAGGGV